MKINFLIFENPHNSPIQHAPSFSSALPQNKVSAQLLQKLCKEVGIVCNVIESGHEDLGELDGDYVVFLDQNNYIANSYVKNLVHGFSLFNCSVLCGPVINFNSVEPPQWFISSISKTFDSYYISTARKQISFDITDDLNNYPPSLINCAFTVEAYNAVGGYKVVHNERVGKIHDGRLINYGAKYKSMTYLSSIGISQILTSKDFEEKNVSKRFYVKGYLEGQRSGNMHASYTLFQKFIEEPETLDYTSAKWISFDKRVPDSEKKKYGEMLVVFKGVYHLGYIEGVLGESII